MPLELKDLATQKSLVVPEEGFTFGREGGDANILLRDTGVSKRHARVFGENGAWFLEDLGSSNGTWLQKERIKDATELLPGDVFQLSQAKFEVLAVVGGEAQEPEETRGARSSTEADMPAEDEQEDENTPKPMQPAAPPPKNNTSKPPPGKEASVSKSKPAPAAAAAKKPEAKSKRGEAPTSIGPESPAAEEALAASGDGKAADAKGIGYFFIAVPKAIAYYLARIPLMIVNPVGSIRKGIEEQPAEPMQKMELIAYALPVNILSALMGALGSVIVVLVTTHSIGGAIAALLGSIVGVAIAVVVSVITGFFFHPVFGWIITKLKGHSDDRSRTNMFLMGNTATAVLAVPAFLAQVLSLVHLPVIGVIPPVLSLGGTVITLFIYYSWMKHFEVIKWVPIIILVLGGLSALSTIPAILHGITGGGSGVTVASAGDMDAQMEAAKKMAEEAEKNAAAAQNDAEKQIAKAAEDTKAAVADANKEVKKAAEETKAAVAEAKDTKKAEDTKAAPPPPEKAAPPPPVAKAEAPVVSGGAGYAAWHLKFDAIEKRVNDDPTILAKNSGIKDLYKDLQEDVFDIEQKFQKATKKPSEKRLNDHLKDAELYEKTEKKVGDLYGKLFK